MTENESLRVKQNENLHENENLKTPSKNFETSNVNLNQKDVFETLNLNRDENFESSNGNQAQDEKTSIEESESLRNIRSWIKKKPDLISRTETNWLLSFLQKCNYDEEKTKERLELFSKFKSGDEQLFNNRDPTQPEIQEILNRGIFIPVLNSSSDGPTVLLVRWKNTHAKKTPFLNMIKVAFMFLDVLILENEGFLKREQQFVEDTEGFAMRYYTQMTPEAWKKLIAGSQDAYTTDIKKYHIINAPIFYGIMYTLVRPFLKNDVKKKLNILRRSKLADLYQDIPASALPKEYGGEGPSVEEIAKTWKAKIEGHRDWFIKDSQQGSQTPK